VEQVQGSEPTAADIEAAIWFVGARRVAELEPSALIQVSIANFSRGSRRIGHQP
jgi:hypothetical protein